MRALRTALLAASLASSLAGCGGDPAAPATSCTREGTNELVAAADLSALLAVAVDAETATVLVQTVAETCCRFCPGGAADRRPLLADTEACIACAAGYGGGNPGDHVTGCGATVCDRAP